MAELRILTRDGRIAFTPGESIEGSVSWQVEDVKSSIVRLYWRTEGKGSQDVKLEAETVFEGPQSVDDRAFRFKAPAGPWSYNGKLIAIVWVLELEVEPGAHVASIDITIKPAL